MRKHTAAPAAAAGNSTSVSSILEVSIIRLHVQRSESRFRLLIRYQCCWNYRHSMSQGPARAPRRFTTSLYQRAKKTAWCRTRKLPIRGPPGRAGDKLFRTPGQKTLAALLAVIDGVRGNQSHNRLILGQLKVAIRPSQ